MSVGQRSPDPEEPTRKSPIQQLVEAFRRRDPDEFKKLVCHFEHPWLLGIANNHPRDRHVGKELPVPSTDFNSVPDRRALDAFAEADTDLERQEIVWRNLPVFLELMHDAVDSMPTELAEVIGTLGALVGDDALGFGPHSDTIDALVGRLDLDYAEASHINEALETFGQIAAALLTARIRPTRQNVDISALVGGLPVVVLLLAVRLDDRRQQLVEAAFATEAQPGAASGATTGREHHSAAPPLVEAEPFAQASSALTARLVQLPWVRTMAEAIQQNPLLAQYLTRGTAATVAGVVAIVAAVGVTSAVVGGSPSGGEREGTAPPVATPVASGDPAAPAPGDPLTGTTLPDLPDPSGQSRPGEPSSGTQPPPTTPGAVPATPGSVPATPGSVPTTPAATPLGSPAWGYASPREFQYEEAVGKEIDLHQQWQWGTWRRSRDPALAGQYATMIRTGTGRYLVRLPGLGPIAGVAHAELSVGWGYHTAVACQMARGWRDGADQMVDVACFDPAGGPKNLPFVVIYVGASKGTTPMLASRYDGASVESATGNPVTVSRNSAGRYTLTSGGAFNGRGFARITPVSTTLAHCRPAETAVTNAGLRIRVECDGPSGTAVDTGWTLSYTEQVGMHHDPSVPAAYLATAGDPANPVIALDRTWSSNGETPTVTRGNIWSPDPPVTGVYRVQYQQIGKPDVYPGDAVAVTAIGPQARFCRTQALNSYSFPRKVLIVVSCYDTTGQPADATFALAYLRAP